MTAGYDIADTERDSQRREFQVIAPSDFPSEVGLLRPDYLLGSAVIEYYNIGLVEPPRQRRHSRQDCLPVLPIRSCRPTSAVAWNSVPVCVSSVACRR